MYSTYLHLHHIQRRIPHKPYAAKYIFIVRSNYADFYIGDLINTNELQKKISLQDIYSANIVGEESVSAAIDSKIIKKSGVKRLKSGLMYAHAYKIIQ